jgi:hypothetical protein
MEKIRSFVQSINDNRISEIKEFYYNFFDLIEKNIINHLAESFLPNYFCLLPEVRFLSKTAKEILDSYLKDDWLLLKADIKYEIKEKKLPNGGFMIEARRISKNRPKRIEDLCPKYKDDEYLRFSNANSYIDKLISKFDFTEYEDILKNLQHLDVNFEVKIDRLNLSLNNRNIWEDFLLKIIFKAFPENHMKDSNIIIKHKINNEDYNLLMEFDFKSFKNELLVGYLSIKPFKFYIQDLKNETLLYPVSIYLPQRDFREYIIFDYNPMQVAKRAIINLESKIYIFKKIIDIIND